MALRVVGAGLPRTATSSLKDALELLLGGRCYHMHEVFDHLDHVPVWRAALRGEEPDWDRFLAGYDAAVDWPASAFWRELADANPNAVILLSTRADARTWWESCDAAILDAARNEPAPQHRDWQAMFHELLRSRIGDWDDAAAAEAFYERHVAEVRATAQAERLLEWRPEQGWEPLCAALGVPAPDKPFPHVNRREDW